MSLTQGNLRLANSRVWNLIDIKTCGRPLGRVASSIAVKLMGKHKPVYDPASDPGDYVVAINCADIAVTGRKLDQKIYRHHTMRPGRLQEISMRNLMAKKGGGEILRKAVTGMLPKNKLRDRMMERLKVFEGEGHPYKKNIARYLEVSEDGSSNRPTVG